MSSTETDATRYVVPIDEIIVLLPLPAQPIPPKVPETLKAGKLRAGGGDAGDR